MLEAGHICQLSVVVTPCHCWRQALTREGEQRRVEASEVARVWGGGAVTMEQCCRTKLAIAACHYTAVGRSSGPARWVEHHTASIAVVTSHKLTRVLAAGGKLTCAEELTGGSELTQARVTASYKLSWLEVRPGSQTNGELIWHLQ